MTKIRYDELTAMTSAINRYFRDNNMSIEIYRKDLWPEKSVEFGVNWAAIGTVSPDETERFADWMKAAARICRYYNDMNYEVDYSERKFSSEEEYTDYFKTIYTGMAFAVACK